MGRWRSGASAARCDFWLLAILIQKASSSLAQPAHEEDALVEVEPAYLLVNEAKEELGALQSLLVHAIWHMIML